MARQGILVQITVGRAAGGAPPITVMLVAACTALGLGTVIQWQDRRFFRQIARSSRTDRGTTTGFSRAHSDRMPGVDNTDLGAARGPRSGSTLYFGHLHPSSEPGKHRFETRALLHRASSLQVRGLPG